MAREWLPLDTSCLRGMDYMICSLHHCSILEYTEWVWLRHLHNCSQLDRAGSEGNQSRWHSNLTNMADKLVTRQQ